MATGIFLRGNSHIPLEMRHADDYVLYFGPATVLTNALSDASPDLMRTLLQTTINTLISSEPEVICGAEYGKPSVERVASRNGHRTRGLDSSAGTVDFVIPKLRSDT